LSTLHERAGAAENLRAGAATDGKAINGAWGRMLLQTYKDQYASIVAPSASAKIAGFQIGADIYRHQQADGQRDHAGAYLAIANANADVTGMLTNAAATGYERRRTGNIQLDAVSGGGYWSHFGHTGWYTDAIVQATSYRGKASTDRATIGIHGIGAMASLEGGYPFQLGHAFSLEPQAQVLYQRVALNNSADRYSTIGLGASNSVLGRVGVRLQHTSKNGDKFMQPYLHANLWSTLAGAGNTVDYAGVDSIATRAGGSWTQVGVGVTARMDKNAYLFANLDGMFNVNTRQRRTGVQAAAGMRVIW
jgi:outer membrane autotransporter protein